MQVVGGGQPVWAGCRVEEGDWYLLEEFVVEGNEEERLHSPVRQIDRGMVEENKRQEHMGQQRVERMPGKRGLRSVVDREQREGQRRLHKAEGR